MIIKLIKTMIFTSVVALGAPAQAVETLESKQISDDVTIVSFGSVRIHTFHGISNSHIIETAHELRVIDTQFILPQAQGLRSYLEGLGKPVAQIIISHNHPDHWFGAQVIEDMAPIVTSAHIADDLEQGGGRYIEIMSKNPKMVDSVPDAVIVPDQVLALGAQNWDGLDVIVEEYADQESHHSVMIKIPEAGIMIGQDLFYNGFFLVASERTRNAHWRDLLQRFSENEVGEYQTLLVGHGLNGGPSILMQDIEYLDALESTLEEGLSQEETTASMVAQFPDFKGEKSFLPISMRNLFSGH